MSVRSELTWIIVWSKQEGANTAKASASRRSSSDMLDEEPGAQVGGVSEYADLRQVLLVEKREAVFTPQ